MHAVSLGWNLQIERQEVKNILNIGQTTTPLYHVLFLRMTSGHPLLRSLVHDVFEQLKFCFESYLNYQIALDEYSTCIIIIYLSTELSQKWNGKCRTTCCLAVSTGWPDLLVPVLECLWIDLPLYWSWWTYQSLYSRFATLCMLAHWRESSRFRIVRWKW